MNGFGFVGTVEGFKKYALREVVRAALAGKTMRDADYLQRRMRRAKAKDILLQIRTQRGGDVA